MNNFEISGKVTHIGNDTRDSGHGITIIHYPENIRDQYVEIGVVLTKEQWLANDIRQFDYIELKGHFVTVNLRSDVRKTKIVHMVDEILSLVHEEH